MARDYAADIADPIAQDIVNNVGSWVDREVKPVANGRVQPPSEPPGARRTSGWRVKMD